MTLQIYNTLSRSKERFEPLEAGQVKMYVCGPTVYDYIHIGNARPLIFFDVVRRYLKNAGYEVKYVVNFTDVDDKLINKSKQTGEPVPDLAERFIEAFFEDTEGLGIERADVHPRVTETMPQIIEFIRDLEEKGFAYESGGDVYFRTKKYEQYGQISHQNMDSLQFGIRIEVDKRKEDPQDFVLWKAAKPEEISWASPWGEGRPGWHIECSTMAREYLGETIDIHGGGQDLAFPHHECEAAQSGARNEQPLARYWMHNGYININNEKMSKSLGNGINVKQLLGMTRGEVVRFFMLSSHYRNPLNFTDESIQQSESAVDRMDNCLTNLKYRMDSASGGPVQEKVRSEVEAENQRFRQKMDDDFNTPDAITAIFELVAKANQYLQNNRVLREELQLFIDVLEELAGILGLLKEQDNLLDEEVEALIEERIAARKNKNWARADEIRDQLTEQGILLEDTPQGLRWRRK